MKSKIKEPTADKIAKVLSSFTEEERKQAFAMLQGMMVGKELANKDKSA